MQCSSILFLKNRLLRRSEFAIMLFQKSDAGAQAAWKGFSSQTLYIASRLILDKNDCEYYPEDVEDLVIRKNGMALWNCHYREKKQNRFMIPLLKHNAIAA